MHATGYSIEYRQVNIIYEFTITDFKEQSYQYRSGYQRTSIASPELNNSMEHPWWKVQLLFIYSSSIVTNKRTFWINSFCIISCELSVNDISNLGSLDTRNSNQIVPQRPKPINKKWKKERYFNYYKRRKGGAGYQFNMWSCGPLIFPQSEVENKVKIAPLLLT